MSEMVERVAQAMQEDEDRHLSTRWGNRGYDQWRGRARTAIAAMREPTPEMLNVGVSMVNFLRHEDAKRVWDSMIDTALADKS